MAFDDSPIVDENSKVSQESVLAVKAFFSKKAGFIAREISDDYGIDLEIELVLEASKASAWSFPVQIKSNTKVKAIEHNGKQFVTVSFLTSRLGYLCRRIPAYGIVVIYDEESKTCFYDYVENIVGRLTNQRDDEDWKKQDSVNINIPIDQLLTETKAKEIAEKVVRRFQNCSMLISEHGGKFNIPSLFTVQKNPSDFDSPDKILGFLENYGIALFNRQDYLLVDFLLSKLSFLQINKSSKLLFIAALTYQGIGRYIDAEYFLNKCLQQEGAYSQEENTFLKYVKSEIEYAFGSLSPQEYELRMKQVFDQLREEEFRVCIKARLLHLKISRAKIEKNDLNKLLIEINELVNLVDKTNLSETMKHHYKIYLATDMLFILATLLTHFSGEIKIREIIYGDVPFKERIDSVQVLLPILKAASDIYQRGLSFADRGNDKLLKAYIYYGQGLALFLIESNMLMLNESQSGINEFRSIYNMLLVAYDYFTESGLLHNAYKALSAAYDTYKSSQLFLKKDINGADEKELLSIMEKLEKVIGLPRYISHVEEKYKELIDIRKATPESQFRNMTKEEKEKYVVDFVRIAGIPQERKANVMADMKFMNDATKALEGTNFQVLQNLNHTKSKESMYATPLRYILECQKCGFRTAEGGQLEKLLNYKRRYHPHTCL